MTSSTVETRAVGTEPAARDWAAIGIGLAAALALIGIYVAGVWALWVIAEALL